MLCLCSVCLQWRLLFTHHFYNSATLPVDHLILGFVFRRCCCECSLWGGTDGYIQKRVSVFEKEQICSILHVSLLLLVSARCVKVACFATGVFGARLFGLRVPQQREHHKSGFVPSTTVLNSDRRWIAQKQCLSEFKMEELEKLTKPSESCTCPSIVNCTIREMFINDVFTISTCCLVSCWCIHMISLLQNQCEGLSVEFARVREASQ